jgi:co-chaperonin GroES (HSP10)
MILPQNSRCLIKLKEEKTKSGIILSTKSNIIYEEAEVLAVGPEVKKIKVGSKILFKSYNLVICELNKDEKAVFIEEKDVEAILK